MKSNNVVIAPQTRDIEVVFQEWSKSHEGGRKAFYKFMTTPSGDRARFMLELTPAVEFAGEALSVII